MRMWLIRAKKKKGGSINLLKVPTWRLKEHVILEAEKFEESFISEVKKDEVEVVAKEVNNYSYQEHQEKRKTIYNYKTFNYEVGTLEAFMKCVNFFLS